MGDYKEELSALVEKIRQDGVKEERERILKMLNKEIFSSERLLSTFAFVKGLSRAADLIEERNE